MKPIENTKVMSPCNDIYEPDIIQNEVAFLLFRINTLLEANKWVVFENAHPLLSARNIAMFVERTWLTPLKKGYTYGKGMGNYYPAEMHLIKAIGLEVITIEDALAMLDKSVLSLSVPPTQAYEHFVNKGFILQENQFCKLNKDKFTIL